MEHDFKYSEQSTKNNLNFKASFIRDKVKIIKIFDIYKQKINFYSELEKIVNIYFDEFFKTIPDNILDDKFNFILKEFMIPLNDITEWSIRNIENCINNFIQNKKIKFYLFGKPLRIVLTNSKNGPSISEILYILDKKNAFLRLNNYINNKT